MKPRVIVIGLDCAPPALVFDRLAPRLPFLRSMRRRGASGTLRSTSPPITVPAWASMVSGRDPGELGIYGFRDRDPDARTLRTVTSKDIHVPRVWDVLGARGLTSSVLFVPPTFPATPIEGELISCMLTPSDAAVRTHPPSLEAELSRITPDLRADVSTEDERSPETLLAALEAQVMRHFDLAEHFLRSRPADFFMMVEMATDRLHHGLWPALDPHDPRHARFAAHARRAEDLYVLLDQRIARVSELVPDATLLVVSDHGARSIEGGFYVNEVLRRAGLLVLHEAPTGPTPLAAAKVDWTRTRAWGEGGYYARIFVNDRARFGDAPEIDRDAVIDEIEALCAALTDASGAALTHRIVRPVNAYRAVRGQAPDLLVYFGDLRHRSLGAVGTRSIHASPDEVDGDRGRGGCNHDWEGIFLATGPGVPRTALEGASILDVGPTLLGRFGITEADWGGRDLLGSPR